MKIKTTIAVSLLTLMGILIPVAMAEAPAKVSPPAVAEVLSFPAEHTTPEPPTTEVSPLGVLNASEQTGYRLEAAFLNGEVTAREFVNSIPYSLHVPFPALRAYEIVAADIGWSEQKIHDWRRFIHAIIRKESGFCPNSRNGIDWKNKGRGCKVGRQGTGSDSGFGQVTKMYFWGPGMPLCELHQLCDGDTIISEPYLSMASVLFTIDDSGSKAWCYTKAQINHKRFGCRFAPDNKHYNPDDSAINFVTDGA